MIYIFILVYFLLGSIGIYFINRRKDPQDARKSWIKHVTYFLIINILFFSIFINPVVFRLVTVLIIFVGFCELFVLFRKSGFNHKKTFIQAVCILAMFSCGFYHFSGMDKGLILFTFFLLSIFDGFSQVTGQLWGRRKLFPKVSPDKTVEGFIGGAITALLSGFLFKDFISAPPLYALLLAAWIVVFAFIGDSAKSFYKRKYKVKDFNNLIPGNGGFLDRFDSLIAGGAGIALLKLLLNFHLG
ncbi:MAG TPA: phosphatidate cytidylyltransferase [Bacteroidales bacterium]|nr:phosphatidate cytidylyltransferase [Bacteroidales bacterium]